LFINVFPFNIPYKWLSYYITYILLMVKMLSFSTTTAETRMKSQNHPQREVCSPADFRIICKSNSAR